MIITRGFGSNTIILLGFGAYSQAVGEEGVTILIYADAGATRSNHPQAIIGRLHSHIDGICHDGNAGVHFYTKGPFGSTNEIHHPYGCYQLRFSEAIGTTSSDKVFWLNTQLKNNGVSSVFVSLDSNNNYVINTK